MPQHEVSRLDDKAAALEANNEYMKAEFKKERFVYIFIISALFLALIAQTANTLTFWLLLISILILLKAIASWLSFPWIIADLTKWTKKVEAIFDRWAGAKPPDDIEPLN